MFKLFMLGLLCTVSLSTFDDEVDQFLEEF